MGLREDLKRALERQKGVVSVVSVVEKEEREEEKERMKRLELQGGRECAKCGILESDYGEKFEDMVVVKGSLEPICRFCVEDGE